MLKLFVAPISIRMSFPLCIKFLQCNIIFNSNCVFFYNEKYILKNCTKKVVRFSGFETLKCPRTKKNVKPMPRG